MKRLIGLVLLALLLCGCGADPQAETTVPPPESTVPAEPTEPAGIYVPGSEVESNTQGSVRCYVPETEDLYGIRGIGDDLILFSGNEETTLTRVTGENLYTIAQTTLDCRIEPEDPSFQLGENGITYYDENSREVVFLDNDLKEVSRLAMSRDMTGKPVLSANRRLVFYCTGTALRVHDTETGLDRLLKEMNYPGQTVTDILLSDQVLRCDITAQDGQQETLFLSAQTGEELGRKENILTISDGNGTYYAQVPEGILSVLIYARRDGPLMMLNPRDTKAPRWALEECSAVLTASLREEKGVLDYYDLETGLRTASVEIPAGFEPRYVQAREGRVFLMGYDRNGPQILRWDIAGCETGDETVYTSIRFTAQNPDAEGLARCGEYAQQIGAKYGVNILFGTEAVEVSPWDYDLVQEYVPSVIWEQLEQLEGCLQHFPDGFLTQISGNINICIVRSITGSAQSGSLDAASGIQFWDGETARVVLAAGESLNQSFWHEIFHVMDSKILSDTRVYYYWRNLNPESVSYFEDYTSYRTADVEQYLRDEDRAFIDAYSLCYAKEDRARIMEYACMEGNEHYFTSGTMQKKLETLCKGIREAFGLEKVQDTFLWEQYLNTSTETE